MNCSRCNTEQEDFVCTKCMKELGMTKCPSCLSCLFNEEKCDFCTNNNLVQKKHNDQYFQEDSDYCEDDNDQNFLYDDEDDDDDNDQNFLYDDEEDEDDQEDEEFD